MSEPSPDDPTFVPAGDHPVPPPADANFPAGFLKEEFVGEGGMGIVFRARDLEAKRTVAVKLLRDCFSANDTNAKLFVAEAELTAQLQHPGVPPVHRVGTLPNGRPFMVMKLIRGDDLKKVLDARSDPRDELPRFLTIFEAIVDTLAFAHDRKPSIIHRDLKPANVVVGKFGEVQVLDWGLAKSADGGTEPPEHTITLIPPRGEELDELSIAAGAKGTPAYMAPEQALDDRDRIGPRSDVFGLGAILCKILTGLPPFEGATAHAVIAQAAAGRVKKAHKRIDECGADPELIALAKKCLAKEPEDRFAHAGELAGALRDWRAAAADRQKRAEIEAAEKRAAEAAAERAKELYLLALNGFNAMVFDVQAKLARRSNTLDLQKQVLGVAREGLQQLTSAAEKHGTPDRTLIWTHYQMGDVYLTLGSTADAQREYRAGGAIAQRLADADPSDAQAQRDLSVSFNKLGNVVLQLGKVDEARGFYARSLEVRERLADADPSDAQAQRDLSVSFNNLGNVVLKLGKVDEARGYYEKYLAIAQRLADADPSDAQAQRDLSVSFNNLGNVVLQLGKVDEARGYYEQDLAIAQRLADADPSDAQAQRDLSISFNKLGNVVLKLGKVDEARGFFEQDLAIAQRLADADPSDAQAQRDLSVSFEKLGDVVLKLGKVDEARGYYARSLEVRERLADADPSDAQAQRDLLFSFYTFGNLHQERGERALAIEWYQKAISVARAFVRPEFFAEEVGILERRIAACRSAD